MQNPKKSWKYFSAHQSQNIKKLNNNKISKNITHVQWNKTDLPKRNNNNNNSNNNKLFYEEMCTVKKVSLKIAPPIYLHSIKKDITQWPITCLNLSKSWYLWPDLETLVEIIPPYFFD